MHSQVTPGERRGQKEFGVNRFLKPYGCSSNSEWALQRSVVQLSQAWVQSQL